MRGFWVLITAVALAACNAVFGVDSLSFESRAQTSSASGSEASGGAVPSASAGGAGGGGAAGSMATGGGGTGGAPIITRTFGDRSDADVRNVTADTDIRSEQPSYNFGGNSRLHGQGKPKYVILLRFDLSSIPTDATVTYGELELWVDDCPNCGSPGPVSIFRLVETWDEGVGFGQLGVANFIERQNDTMWTAPGAGEGSYALPLLASVRELPLGTLHVIELPVGLFSGWVANPSTNFGVVLRSVGMDYVAFVSRENVEESKRPLLRIKYQR